MHSGSVAVLGKLICTRISSDSIVHCRWRKHERNVIMFHKNQHLYDRGMFGKGIYWFAAPLSLVRLLNIQFIYLQNKMKDNTESVPISPETILRVKYKFISGD